MSNIMMLVRAEKSGAKCKIIDDRYELIVSDKEVLLEGIPGQTISILPLTGEIDVVAYGLEYPLNNLSLKWGSSRGVSNLFLENNARIIISGGYALIVKVK